MKVFFLSLLGAAAVLVLVVLSPLVLVYFLFDRFCSLVEELAPTKGRQQKENGNGRWGLLKQLFSTYSQNVQNPASARGLLPHQRPF